MSENEADQQAQTGHNKYRKPKPWDTPDIDKWSMEEFRPGDMQGQLLAKSEFKVLYPKYRAVYIQESWGAITKALRNKLEISAELDTKEKSMTVSTTKKTWDPWAIMRARDYVNVLARSVPIQQANKVLEEGVAVDIVKIGNQVRNKQKFMNRRQRLFGPEGSTLKALQLLTECYIMIQGNTVTCIGKHKGLKQARRVIIECMNNVHPIYNIKILMLRKELEKDPEKAGENWDKYLPVFKHKNVQTKKPSFIAEKSAEKPIFPPAPTPSKIDLQLESGEYFMSKHQIDKEKKAEKLKRSAEVTKERQKEKQKRYEAPEHKTYTAPVVATEKTTSDLISSLKSSSTDSKPKPINIKKKKEKLAHIQAEPRAGKRVKKDSDKKKKKKKKF